jgi:hypothetical protein
MTIKDLDVLVGNWHLTGRTDGADHDDITGELTATPALHGRMLLLEGSMQVGGQVIDSIELIWRDESRPGYQAHVHSGTGDPLIYRWDIDGDTLTHGGLGMTYTGTISADGSTITGRWVADPDRPDMTEANYSATMTRVP